MTRTATAVPAPRAATLSDTARQPLTSADRSHRGSKFSVGRKHAVKSRQVQPRSRHQPRQACHQPGPQKSRAPGQSVSGVPASSSRIIRGPVVWASRRKVERARGGAGGSHPCQAPSSRGQRREIDPGGWRADFRERVAAGLVTRPVAPRRRDPDSAALRRRDLPAKRRRGEAQHRRSTNRLLLDRTNRQPIDRLRPIRRKRGACAARRARTLRR